MCHQTLIASFSCCKTNHAAFKKIVQLVIVWNLTVSAGRTSPHLDSLTKGPSLEQAVQAPPSAAPAPPAPVGLRSQVGASAPRLTSTTAGSQRPPDLLEQRKGTETCWDCNGYSPQW